MEQDLRIPETEGSPAPRAGVFARRIRTTAGIFCGALLLLSGGVDSAPRTSPPMLRPPRAEQAIRVALGLGAHAGDCSRCHSQHGGDQPNVYPNALAGPNDNSQCLQCHSSGDSFFGNVLYLGTGHGSAPTMVWPGPSPPPRIEFDAPTKCLNCHDPHGWVEGDSLVPHLALAREENLCLACHDGHPAVTDVRTELSMPFRHPVTLYRGRHAGAGESDPTDFGEVPLHRRHSECEDCHNPHVSRPDRLGGPSGIDASRTTLGVSRVRVLNGAAGEAPAYTFIAGTDTLSPPNAEYQLCFKCHSSWTTQPSGQSDLAVLLNPNNPSFHPVEATGRNPAIHALAFAGGWSAGSLTRCGDCHGSDVASIRGVHGSAYAGILRKASPTQSLTHVSTFDELCFSCHAFGVYADTTALPPLGAESRFNAPAAPYGHAGHVFGSQVPCYACHQTHGSAVQPFLIAIGRVPGLTSFLVTPTGGTCSSTCHVDTRTYGVNYAR